MTQGKKRINIIVRHHIRLARLAEQRTHRRVILPRLRRALLKIKWEQRETPGLLFRLISSAGPREYLDQLPAILRSETSVSQYRITEIVFVPFDGGIRRVRKQRRQRPGSLRVFLFGIEKRSQDLRPMTRLEGQFIIVVKKPDVQPIPSQNVRGPHDSQTQAANCKNLEFQSKDKETGTCSCTETPSPPLIVI